MLETRSRSGLSSSVLVPSNRPQPELQVILLPKLPDRAPMQIFRSFSRDTVFGYYRIVHTHLAELIPKFAAIIVPIVQFQKIVPPQVIRTRAPRM